MGSWSRAHRLFRIGFTVPLKLASRGITTAKFLLEARLGIPELLSSESPWLAPHTREDASITTLSSPSSGISAMIAAEGKRDPNKTAQMNDLTPLTFFIIPPGY
jgi:hypothetical protein